MDNDEIDSLISSAMETMKASGFAEDTLYSYFLAFRAISAAARGEGQSLFTAEFALSLISEERPAKSCWDRRCRRQAVKRLCEQAGIADKVFPQPAPKGPMSRCPERFRDDLRDFREYEVKRGLADSTVEGRVEVAAGFMAFMDERVERLEDATVKDVDAYFIEQSLKNSGVTVCNRRTCIREILRFLDQRYDMGGAVVAAASGGGKSVRPGLQTFLTPDEMRRMLQAAESATARPKRAVLVTAFLMQYPVRNVDLRRLKIGDIDWAEGTVTVRAGKNGEVRCYPLTDKMRLIIADYLKNERPPSSAEELVVSTRWPYPPLKDAQVLGRIVKKVARAAGVQVEGRRIGPHAVRRSVATTLMEHDVPYPVISEMLIHRWGGTAFSGATMTYLKADVEALRGVVLGVPHAK